MNIIKNTTKKDAMKKAEVIRSISLATGLKQIVVKSVLDAFVDIHQREVLTTGAWAYPGMPSVTRSIKKATKRTLPDSDVVIEYPETAQLRAAIPESIKLEHRKICKRINEELTKKDD